MKNSICKKIISIALTLILIFAMAIPAFATDTEDVPVIVISGMNSFELVEESTQTTAWVPETDAIVSAVLDIAFPLVASLVTSDWSIFTESSTERIGDAMELVTCDENGEPNYELSVPTYPLAMSNYLDEICFTEEEETDEIEYFKDIEQTGVVIGVAEKIGWDKTYFLNYDWRLSAIDIAEDLNIMVEQAKADHDCEEVSIVAISMGGAILSAYIDTYGTDSVSNLVFASTAMTGVSVVGELYSGDLEVTLSEVLEYLGSMIGIDFVDMMLDGVSNLASTSFFGFSSAEEKFNAYLDSTLDEIEYSVFNDIFMDTFFAMYGMWSLVPNEYYEAAKEYIASYGVLSDEFFEKTDTYNEIQLRLEDNLKAAQADGVGVYITASYGYMSMPLTSGSDARTDNLIDTYHMSGYCTIANYGETLDDLTYESSTTCTDETHTHISTDNVVDASTAMFPETTWVIADMQHVVYPLGSDANDLIVWLATTSESVDVYSNSNFPQFVKFDVDSGNFSSLTEGVILINDTMSTENFIETIIGYLTSTLEAVKDYLGL